MTNSPDPAALTKWTMGGGLLQGRLAEFTHFASTGQTNFNGAGLQTTGGLGIAFNRTGGTSNGNFSAVTDNTNGTYTAVFTAQTAGTATTIGATISGSAVPVARSATSGDGWPAVANVAVAACVSMTR